jgi:protein-tyrosine phosphatase
LQSIFTSQPNFRDLGGIQTMDGRKVKPGLLFRSGELHDFSPEEIRRLEEMKLTAIIDLRAQREINERPDRLVGTVKEVIHLGIHDAARDQAVKFLENNNAEGLENILTGDYIRMVRKHQPEFRRFLEILANTENLPLVYHCAAGKDRTGLATVFLMAALGVDIRQIREDYIATNEFVKFNAQKFILKVTELGLNGEILRPMLEVRMEYLDAALDEITRISGSLHDYVTGVLKADVLKLQERYLEIG